LSGRGSEQVSETFRSIQQVNASDGNGPGVLPAGAVRRA